MGGTEAFVLNLARRQKDEGYGVQVLTLNRDFRTGKPLPCGDMVEGIKIHRIPFWGSKRYPLAFSCFHYLKKCDIIHIHGVDFFLDYLIFLKCFHRKKVILHTHGGYFHTRFLFVLKKIYFYTVTRMVLAFCDKVVTVSSNDYALFSSIAYNVVEVPNGIDFARLSAIEKKQGSVLVTVGRVDGHKRIDRLIRLVAELKSQDVPVALKVIGPDWKDLSKKLKELARSLGVENNIVFSGRLSDKDLLRELASARAFLCASEYEGFGIAALEAMATATVPVLSNIAAFRQLIRDKVNGMLVEFEDTPAAARAVISLLKMDRAAYRTMGRLAQETAAAYDWSRVSSEIGKIYRECMSG